MRINHNIAALNTFRQLTANTVGANKSLEKLSSSHQSRWGRCRWPGHFGKMWVRSAVWKWLKNAQDGIR